VKFIFALPAFFNPALWTTEFIIFLKPASPDANLFGIFIYLSAWFD
jgi:hypothetical protein